MAKVLGIDPGLTNCGLCVVERAGIKYKSLMSYTMVTDSELARGHRLFLLANEIEAAIEDYKVELVAVERIFFSKNKTSALDTESVIGAAELAAYKCGVESLLLTPQEVKAASGLGGKASKRVVQRMMERITAGKFVTHHDADAAAVAIAGLLRFNSIRSRRENYRNLK